MDDLHEELDEGGVSRRDALKKMAVTAAGFWAVPVISSFRSPAFANTSPACDCDPLEPCSGLDDCGGPDAECGCVPTTVSGECFCHQAQGCDGLTACTTQADCVSSTTVPAGSVCAFSCCGAAGQAYCLPPCGVTDGLRRAARVEGEAWSTR